MAEDEMVGWHHQLNGQESEQTLRESEGHGSLACCSPWGRRVGHNSATEQQQRASGQNNAWHRAGAQLISLFESMSMHTHTQYAGILLSAVP